MTYGYIYCFSNPSMPGILKIGMTERTPEARRSEANASDTWRPPTPYKIEFAKKVSNPSQKEKTLHILLEQYTTRIHPRREFFRVSLEEIGKFFDLMDGEMWAETRKEEEEEEEEENTLESATQVKATGVKGCRVMAQCFTNGQRIRHTIGINKTWVGTYDVSKDGIICHGQLYKTLSEMAKAHNKVELPHRATNTANGWKECECEIDGKWISTYSLSANSEEEKEEEEKNTFESATPVTLTGVKRVMAQCFTNGQRIRHTIGVDKTWVGTYDVSKNGIICHGQLYDTLYDMAKAHNKVELPHWVAIPESSGWTECECEIDGQWISTYSLFGDWLTGGSKFLCKRV